MKPVTRKEVFMKAIAEGKEPGISPLTREEALMAAHAKREASGGGTSDREHVNPDWGQNNEYARDYVINRTHYIDYNYNWKRQFGRNVRDGIVVDQHYSFEDNIASYSKLDVQQSGKKLYFDADYGPMYDENYEEIGYRVAFDGGNIELYNLRGSDVVYVKGISEGSLVFFDTADYAEEVVYQLDEMYIPDSIARVSDVPNIPPVTADDSGKVLGVVNGEIAWVSMT